MEIWKKMCVGVFFLNTVYNMPHNALAQHFAVDHV